MKLSDEERAQVATQLIRRVPNVDADELSAIEQALDEGEADVAAGRVDKMSDVLKELRDTLC